ncbi:hypothetical protein ABW21_db0202181 [Orbilia brochopaga]|nr:hypothetical protein ABW21_db0202181 [Drechslerella brochopaga]
MEKIEPRPPSEGPSVPPSSSSTVCINLALPPEVLYRVFTAVDDPQVLCRAERTCHLWRSIIDSQALWRNLAAKLASSRILPERLNELGKGSLIAGRYTLDDGNPRWTYLYRDLVRAIHAFNRIPGDDYRFISDQHAPGSPTLSALIAGPTIVNARSSMPELPPLPPDCPDGSYVTRRIDFTLSAVEGMRLQNRPLQNSKTPPFTDCLCPGETAAEETAWVFFADQAPNWPHLTSNIFAGMQPEQAHTTIQRGVFRAGTNGIFGDGSWHWPATPVDTNTDNDTPTTSSSATTELKEETDKTAVDATPKRPWKVFATRARSAAFANSPKAVSEDTPPPPAQPKPLPDPIKWASPIDTARSLPHSRRWDPAHSVYQSFRSAFNLSADERDRYEASTHNFEGLANSLYGAMRNQAHSDPNLRVSYRRVRHSFPELVATKIERLALPPSSSLKRDDVYPTEPAPIVNQKWNLFGGAKWSLNSVPSLAEFAALAIDGPAADLFIDSSGDTPDPWWFHETSFKFSDDQTEETFENSNTWEFRSCGDYLIVSDDISMSGPSTISCFKAGYHMEKADIDPHTFMRGAVLRNYLEAGPSSDLVWQRSMRMPGYRFDHASASPVRCTDDPNDPLAQPCYFLDQDGLALNSKTAVYATRKKVFYRLIRDQPVGADVIRNLSCMEFHVLSLENGQTLSILDLDHEKRVLTPSEPWYGWVSFVVSDTHLLACVGGNVHSDSGAEHEPDTVAMTWKEERRYGREEVFVWPLDGTPFERQNLSLPPEERKILPTGRLGVGFNGHRWWRRDRYLCLSRDGRFLCVSAKYDLIVWDLWDVKKQPIHYFYDKDDGTLKIGADGYLATTLDNVAWNGIWLQYRDVVVDPTQQSFTRHNPPVERELQRKTIFIPNNELRMLVGGADYAFQATAAGQTAVGTLERLSRRRYHPVGNDEDRSSESDDLDTDDDDDDMDDDEDGDWDFDEGMPLPWNTYTDDDDEMYEDAQSDSGSYDSDMDEMGIDVQHVPGTWTTAAAATDTGGEEIVAPAGGNSSTQRPQDAAVDDSGWGADVSAGAGEASGWTMDDVNSNVEDGW